MNKNMQLQINDYELIECAEVFNQSKLYKFRCKICGHERVMHISEFKRLKNNHNAKNCKEDYFKSLIGKEFGDYIVISSKENSHIVKCKICGFEKKVISNVLYNSIGLSHRYCETFIKDKYYKKLHSSWTCMRARTNNKKSISYKNYGGRGITSEDFKCFDTFYHYALPLLLEAEKKYNTFKLSIDRIDNDKGYSIGNIRFSTIGIQNRNRRTNKWCTAISPEKVEYSFNVASDFAKIHNLCKSCITLCLQGKQKSHKGWVFYYS
jgi:transcription elongation factor Elf1